VVQAWPQAAPLARDVRAWPGRGLQGTVGAHTVYVGSLRMMRELGLDVSTLALRSQPYAARGATVSWLARSGAGAAAAGAPTLLGMLVFEDAVRPQAVQALAALARMGVRTLMISGDSQDSANAVAAALGISQVRSEVLPADKAALIEALKREGRVAMVGDGVNDAPALAAADVGMAMAGATPDGASVRGADVAIQAASITLLRGDLRLVPQAIQISRLTRAKIRQNLFWALVYNLIGLPLAALGLLNPVIAGAAMALSSVSVLANALWLRRSIQRLPA
jgi:Cu+-exporting ATPase